MIVLMISRSCLNTGHVRSKTRSLDRISLKPFLPSFGNSFASIIMKLHQNIFISSPEHFVFKMSYCYDHVSVVRASSVVRRQHFPCLPPEATV